ncbi:glycosyltransferase [Hydrocoleum sp. CS-953]|uniref:glycosyltransferase n=1 Tax=Hydrocoleum sp. CS-953 TaxID=1671698 RepID=UPI000B9A371C|nr:glycosyltransferase [Hydrocoleum sp. CS-953]
MSLSENQENVQPLISVAICTHNRADRLILALDGLIKQSLASQNFEVLIIDNASQDNTQEIGDRYQEKYSNFRYIYEPVLGLSKARNSALNQAKAKYIAYLDDDAIPSEEWLESILDSFTTVEPSPVCVGGPIYGLWEIPKPDWIDRSMEDFFTVLDYGSKPKWFKTNKFPYGANMTYRKESLKSVGGFNEKLGRKGKKLLSQEELLLNIILEQQGGKFYYNPKAFVQHWVPKERINAEWLLSRSYWQGRSDAIADKVIGKPLYYQYQESLSNLLNLKRVIAQLWPQKKVRLTTRSRIWRSWGYFVEVWLNK